MSNTRAILSVEKFSARIRGAPEVLPAIIESVAEEVLNLVKEGFRQERDPYGHKWAPKKFPDGRKVLSGKTSRLKNFQLKATTRDSFTIGPTVEYAKYHQEGTEFMAQRAMLPIDDVWPTDWVNALDELIEDALEHAVATE